MNCSVIYDQSVRKIVSIDFWQYKVEVEISIMARLHLLPPLDETSIARFLHNLRTHLLSFEDFLDNLSNKLHLYLFRSLIGPHSPSNFYEYWNKI